MKANYVMHMSIVLLSVATLFYSSLMGPIMVKAWMEAGPTNRFYSIPFYFGARVKDWNNTMSYYEDNPTIFFWGYSWNIDYLGNLWVVDKGKHSVYYISKELDTWNAIFKVSGEEYLPGMQDGNIAMGTFNAPTSIAVWDNNPDRRKMFDNLVLIQLWDKFYDPNADYETLRQYNDCMKWVNRSSADLDKCGYVRPPEFQEPEGVSEEEVMKAYLDWGRVDFRRVKLISLDPPEQKFEHEYPIVIDPRIVYISDTGNNCIRRIKVKLRNVDTFAGLCGESGFKDGLFG